MVFRPMWKPTPEEVLDAVRSLYDDEIKPLGRVIAHRVLEKAGNDQDTETARKPKIDSKVLREICEGLPEVTVERAELREFAVLLKNDDRNIVNMFSPVDPYPAEFWQQVGEYFGSLEGSLARLPLGRYPCAVELTSRKPPFLAGRTLGQVCHIVHLAICPRKLLGILDVYRVPYQMSDKDAAELEAVEEMPSSPGRPQLQLSHAAERPRELKAKREAEWTDIREGLRIMFSSAKSPTPGSVLLTTVKRLFMKDLKLDLNERALGYTKLSDLLKDGRLADVCRVADDNKSVHDVSRPPSEDAPSVEVRQRGEPSRGLSRPAAALQRVSVGAVGLGLSPWRTRAPAYPSPLRQFSSLPPSKYEWVQTSVPGYWVKGLEPWDRHLAAPMWQSACPWTAGLLRQNAWGPAYKALEPNSYAMSSPVGLEPAMQYGEPETLNIDTADGTEGQAHGPPASTVPPPRFCEYSSIKFVASF